MASGQARNAPVQASETPLLWPTAPGWPWYEINFAVAAASKTTPRLAVLRGPFRSDGDTDPPSFWIPGGCTVQPCTALLFAFSSP